MLKLGTTDFNKSSLHTKQYDRYEKEGPRPRPGTYVDSISNGRVRRELTEPVNKHL